LHTDGHFDKGKAFGNLSADISGMEIGNEEHSVKQIMKPKNFIWKGGQLSAAISGAEIANEEHNVNQIMKPKNIMLERTVTICQPTSAEQKTANEQHSVKQIMKSKNNTARKQLKAGELGATQTNKRN
jgi:hypothetical protein